MKSVKQIILRIFFVIETVVFAWMYIFGAQGVRVLHTLDAENHELECTVQHMRDELRELDQRIITWENEPFHKEKIAREQLQMARAGDTIYYRD
ncbi:MAG TPA: septum formation initiator family protein [Candidatus Dependentiae bacterium]|nr:septum formation initiator family protein [Candidatus Dependentiae bacterium]HRQ62634.1 septum formation initiator family protein [Candidatus Dependentiae bacterium]